MDGAKDVIPAVILVLVGTVIAKWNYTCPSETSSMTNGSESAVWRSRGIDNEIVISMPPCVDHFDSLITRICKGGAWIPRDVPKCHHFFVEEDRENDFRPECEEEEPSGYGVRWLPYQRKTNYGPYESIERDEGYGTPLEDNVTYAVTFKRSELFKKNCLLESYVSMQIFPEFCFKQAPNYCHKTKLEECPSNCVEGGQQTCFCKTWRDDCDKLAGIRTFSDRQTMVELLDDDDECRLANSQSLSKRSWLYTNKKSHCWICETSPVPRNLPEATMVLNFDAKSRELHLTVYHPHSLYHRGNQDLVYCFTDASKHLRKRVKVRKLFEHYGTDVFFVYEVKLEDYIGNYWCESYKSADLFGGDPVTSNRILGYRKKRGNEYSLRLEIRDACQLFDCPKKTLYVAFEDFIPANVTEAFKGIGLKVALRVMEVFFFDFELLDILIHVTTLRRRPVEGEFAAMQEELAKLEGQITVLFFRSSEYCVEETTISGTSMITWPTTCIGRAVTTDEICLQVNGFPVYRTCGGEFMHGSQWRDANGDCQPIEPTDCTKYIHSIASQNISDMALANVTDLVGREELTVLDVYYLARILRNVVDEEAAAGTLLEHAMTLIDELLRVDSATLSEAQQMLNATDEIIDTVQELLSRHFSAFVLQKRNFLVHVTIPHVSNVTGVVVYRDNDSYISGDFLRGTTLEDVEKTEGFYFAVHVPDAQLVEWENLNRTTFPHKLMIITTIYFNDRFFSNNAKNVSGPIVDVVVPGFGNYLQNPIPIWYKAQPDGAQESPECAFWDYGKKTRRHKGYWSSLGGSYRGLTDDVVHVCEFTHLTHFALLVSKMDIYKTDEDALDLIIVIGDSLTLLGISGIFLTAFLFETWRRKQGTKILLNLCISIVCEVILMLVLQSELIVTNKSCKIWGPLLHYFVLSKFCWMLVYAFLQHMRFVKVLGAIPSNIVLKSSFFGWGFPIVPVLSVCFIETYQYDLGNYLLCYPQGLPLYLGLLAPIIAIILINTIVFAVVMRHVTAKTAEVHSKSADVTSNKLQLQLATLLFFVLGLPMVFGLLCNLVPISWFRTVLIYIFALTSNVQGLVLFVFYVLLNKETRGKWVKYFGGRQKLISSSSSSRSKL